MSVNEVQLRDDLQSRASEYGFSIQHEGKNEIRVVDKDNIIIYTHRLAQDDYTYSNAEYEHIMHHLDTAARNRGSL